MGTGVAGFLQTVQAQLGKPYVFGAVGPNTFDCSGLVLYAANSVGVSVPRTSEEQQAWATPVTVPEPGDLVFYGNPAYHVGIYMGNGMMIDAPDVGKDVEWDTTGHATSYGRIPGLQGAGSPSVILASATTGSGPGPAPTWGPAWLPWNWPSDAANSASSTVTTALAGGRSIAIEIAFVGLGLALVLGGAFVTVWPSVRQQGNRVLGAVGAGGGDE